jgi:glucose-6-phosphate 1-epimerase
VALHALHQVRVVHQVEVSPGQFLLQKVGEQLAADVQAPRAAREQREAQQRGDPRAGVASVHHDAARRGRKRAVGHARAPIHGGQRGARELGHLRELEALEEQFVCARRQRAGRQGTFGHHERSSATAGAQLRQGMFPDLCFRVRVYQQAALQRALVFELRVVREPLGLGLLSHELLEIAANSGHLVRHARGRGLGREPDAQLKPAIVRHDALRHGGLPRQQRRQRQQAAQVACCLSPRKEETAHTLVFPLCAAPMTTQQAGKLAKTMDSIVAIQNGPAKVHVALFGATVTHYSVDASDKNVLFVSSKAILDGSKPIRGGIPLVFPMFGAGDGTLPSHGFARVSVWTVKAETPSSVVLALRSEDISTPWPHKFALEYTVALSESGALRTGLRIKNTHDAGAFAFQALLHTYFSVPDATKLVVSGLQGCQYIDQVLAGRECQLAGEEEEGEGRVTISKETDWIVKHVPGDVELLLHRPAAASARAAGFTIKRRFTIAGQLEPSDVVVWNPWIEKSKKMADFGDDEYQRMICVEPGKVSSFASLGAGEEAVLEQELLPRL